MLQLSGQHFEHFYIHGQFCLMELLVDISGFLILVPAAISLSIMIHHEKNVVKLNGIVQLKYNNMWHITIILDNTTPKSC